MLVITGVGCREVYYRVLDRVGIEKRDLLVDRVKAARDGQDEARDEFQSALERWKE
ncbi:MAG: DUF2959 family protein, partial [Phycisphaerales bacterium]|nr:DUF2959 family protein [Phycisphaerales bacterium]